MKFKVYITTIFILAALVSVYAGNPDRQGQAGAPELLMNPWGRSAGLHSMSTSSAMGIEAMRINIAGLSRINSLEVGISNNRLYAGSGLNFNAAGIGFKLGKTGTMGIELGSLDFGDIPITTVDQPAGTGGFLNPSFFQIGLGYSVLYANKISVGGMVRLVSEAIQDVSATGVAIDAGVQYVSGPKDNFRLGISLRNVGSQMSFGGEGLTVRNQNPDRREAEYLIAFDSRAASFELPSMLNIGVSYDFYFGEQNFVRGLANFTSNAFSRDQVGVGAEFSFLNKFTVRGAYKLDIGETAGIIGANLYTGLAGGFSVDLPLSRENSNTIGIDYGFRATNPFNGSHNLTVRYGF
jgi:hypothetical protein